MIETKVRRYEQKRLVRCFKCGDKSCLINLEIPVMNKIRSLCQKKRIVPAQKKVLTGCLKKCEKCTNSNAAYECLTCDFLLCKQCFRNHQDIQVNKAHRVI